jgi:hypothetical protein
MLTVAGLASDEQWVTASSSSLAEHSNELRHCSKFQETRVCQNGTNLSEKQWE